MSSTNPSLQLYTVDLSNVVYTVGTIYKFILTATNNAGSVSTSALSVALASLPDKPPSAPTVDIIGTSLNQITVDITTFGAAINGGSPILTY